MDRTAEELIAIVRASLSGAPLPAGFTVGDGAALLSLARRQEMAHLLCVPLASARLLPTLPEAVQTEITEVHLRAIVRTAQLTHELRQISAVLDRLSVPYIPLKGAALRELWPNPWKRTSCDIDVLVRPEDAPRAAEALIAELGYSARSLGHHDHSLYSPSGVHLELHFSLALNIPADCVLARVWEYAAPCGEGSACHRLDPAFACVYLAAHHAAHLLAGGGGIRPIFDLIFLLRATPPDEALLNALLAEAGLAVFFRAVTELGEAIMLGATLSTPSKALCEWLLSGRIYGDLDRRAVIRHTARGDRARRRARRRYLRTRLFPPRRELSVTYPVLRRAPVLLPFVWCHRWLSLLFSGRLRLTLRRARAAARTTDEGVATAAELLIALELTPPPV